MSKPNYVLKCVFCIAARKEAAVLNGTEATIPPMCPLFNMPCFALDPKVMSSEKSFNAMINEAAKNTSGELLMSSPTVSNEYVDKMYKTYLDLDKS